MKKIGNVLFLYFFVFVMCMGASFAWYVWQGANVDVNVVFSSVDKYINYETSVSDSEDALTPSEDYTSGICQDINITKKDIAKNLDLFGSLYLTVDECDSSNCDNYNNLFKSSSLKWTLVSVDSTGKETAINTGNFVGEAVGNEIPTYINFELDETTTYKSCIWIDESSNHNLDISGLSLNTNITAEAKPNDTTTASMNDDLYVTRVEYGGGYITDITLYSSMYPITGYMFTTGSVPSTTDEGWTTVDTGTSIEEHILDVEVNQEMSETTSVCVKNSNSKVYCKSVGEYDDTVDVTYNSNNLLYNLVDVSNVTTTNMVYSVSNGVVTVTGKNADGYGYTNGRVYLEAGKEYIFSCDSSGTWGSTVQAFLMLNGATATYYHMSGNNNYAFTPSTTGVYWLRLDVNAVDVTHTFSNINISYNADVKSTMYGHPYGTLPTITRVGYTHNGWYNAASGGTQITSTTTMSSSSDHTVFSQWTANTYTVAYNNTCSLTKGGSTADSTHTYEVYKNLTANGYTCSAKVTYDYQGATGGNTNASATATSTFNGWATTSGGSVVYSNSESVVNLATSGTVTLYTNWTNKSVSCPTPTKTGYTFAGWYDASTGGNKVCDAGGTYTPNAGTKTIYARWTANTYTVTLDNQSATTAGIAKVYYQYNTTQTIDGVTCYYYTDSALTTCLTNGTTIVKPTKTGHTFNGYFTSTGGSGTQYVNADGTFINNIYKTTGDKTLYANWTMNSYTLTVKPNGGTWNSVTTDSTFTQNYGTTKSIAVPSANAYYTISYNVNGGTSGTPTATKAYRAFTGWTLSGSGSITSTTPVATSAQTYTFGAGAGTLTAGYNSTANSTAIASVSRSYTITYNENSTSATVTASDASKVVNYTMNGWYTAASGGTKRASNGGSYAPTASETVYAQWTAGTTTLATLSKTEHTCTWNTKADGSGTSYASGKTGYTTSANVTLYAICTPNVYSVTLNNQSATTAGTTTVYYQYNTTQTIDGVTCYYYTDSALTTCLTDGATITKPTKTGYTFKGYFTSTGGSGTQYVNSSGGFINNVYKTTGDKTLYAYWIDDIAPSVPTYSAFYDDGSGTYISGNWATKQVNTTLTSTDSGIGVAYFQYQKNGGSWTTLSLVESGGLSVSGVTATGTEAWSVIDGRNDTVYFRACDAGEDGTAQNDDDNCSGSSIVYNIKYDNAVPSLSLSKETYHEGFTDWSLFSGSSVSDGQLSMTTSGNASSPYYMVDEGEWYMTLDGYTSTAASDSTNAAYGGSAGVGAGGLHITNGYYDSSYISEVSSNGYSGNGWAPSLPLNTWSNGFTWDGWAGFGTKYLKLFIHSDSIYTQPPTYIRNLRVYGNKMYAPFYLINVSVSDNIGVTKLKYAAGNQNASYFASNGTDFSNNQIRVTSNQTYTVYAEDAAGNNTTKTITVDRVDTTAPTVNNSYSGKMLYTDPEFASGTNSTYVYNNSGNGNVTITRKSISGIPNSSGYGLEIVTSGAASPGHGGFYFANMSAADKQFITRIVAKIPSGYSINLGTNAIGTGYSTEWVTSQAGTGDWEEYILKINCGSSGSFSSTNYFYLSGGSTASTSSPVTWQVAYATVIDATAADSSTNYIITVASDNLSGIIGYQYTTSNSRPTSWNNVINNTYASAVYPVTSNGTYYAWYKDAAGNVSSSKSVSASFYYLDLNGFLDNSSNGGISGYGTADVYINGTLVCNDCTDYWTPWPSGTSYQITDIKAATGHTYNGVYSGSLSGTIGTSNVGVKLNFSTNYYNVYAQYYYVYAATTSYHMTTTTASIAYGGTYTPSYEVSSPDGYYTVGSYEYYNSAGNYVTSYSFGTSFTVTDTVFLHLYFYPYQYSISYNANGGSGAPSTQYYYYDVDTNLSTTIPTWSGYTFLGWSLSSTATSASYTAGQAWSGTNAANYTLYAIWESSFETFNAYRTTGGAGGSTTDILYITTCQPRTVSGAYCNYTSKNLISSTSTITRSNLGSGGSTNSIGTYGSATGCGTSGCSVWAWTEPGLTTSNYSSASQVVGVMYTNKSSTTYPIYKTSSTSGNYIKTFFTYDTAVYAINNFLLQGTYSSYAYYSGTIESVSVLGTTYYYAWILSNYIG